MLCRETLPSHPGVERESAGGGQGVPEDSSRPGTRPWSSAHCRKVARSGSSAGTPSCVGEAVRHLAPASSPTSRRGCRRTPASRRRSPRSGPGSGPRARRAPGPGSPAGPSGSRSGCSVGVGVGSSGSGRARRRLGRGRVGSWSGSGSGPCSGRGRPVGCSSGRRGRGAGARRRLGGPLASARAAGRCSRTARVTARSGHLRSRDGSGAVTGRVGTGRVSTDGEQVAVAAGRGRSPSPARRTPGCGCSAAGRRRPPGRGREVAAAGAQVDRGPERGVVDVLHVAACRRRHRRPRPRPTSTGRNCMGPTARSKRRSPSSSPGVGVARPREVPCRPSSRGPTIAGLGDPVAVEVAAADLAVVGLHLADGGQQRPVEPADVVGGVDDDRRALVGRQGRRRGSDCWPSPAGRVSDGETRGGRPARRAAAGRAAHGRDGRRGGRRRGRSRDRRARRPGRLARQLAVTAP